MSQFLGASLRISRYSLSTGQEMLRPLGDDSLNFFPKSLQTCSAQRLHHQMLQRNVLSPRGLPSYGSRYSSGRHIRDSFPEDQKHILDQITFPSIFVLFLLTVVERDPRFHLFQQVNYSWNNSEIYHNLETSVKK